MNNRAITLSLAFAAFAVFMVQSYVSSIEETAKKKFGTEVLVVTAKRDIKELDTIDETMLDLAPVPKLFLEPNAISFQKSDDDQKSVRDMRSLAGTVAIVPIKKGEQITFNKLTEPSIRTGLAPQITPGKRAIAVPVNEISGVAKLVKPGDRVDIIGIFDGGGGRQNRLARTILQDVVVLAVGRNVTNNVPRVLEKEAVGDGVRMTNLARFDGFASVTLEVDPTQAQVMALMMSVGESGSSIFLSLRNNDDTDRVGSVGSLNMFDVLGPDASRVRAPAATIQGGRR